MSTCTRSIRRRNIDMPDVRLPQLLDVRPELADLGRGFVHALGVSAA